MKLPEPLPGTHLARVDCNGCGTYVLAVPHAVDYARCSACWEEEVERLRLTRAARMTRPPGEH